MLLPDIIKKGYYIMDHEQGELPQQIEKLFDAAYALNGAHFYPHCGTFCRPSEHRVAQGLDTDGIGHIRLKWTEPNSVSVAYPSVLMDLKRLWSQRNFGKSVTDAQLPEERLNEHLSLMQFEGSPEQAADWLVMKKKEVVHQLFQQCIQGIERIKKYLDDIDNANVRDIRELWGNKVGRTIASFRADAIQKAVDELLCISLSRGDGFQKALGKRPPVDETFLSSWREDYVEYQGAPLTLALLPYEKEGRNLCFKLNPDETVNKAFLCGVMHELFGEQFDAKAGLLTLKNNIETLEGLCRTAEKLQQLFHKNSNVSIYVNGELVKPDGNPDAWMKPSEIYPGCPLPPGLSGGD